MAFSTQLKQAMGKELCALDVALELGVELELVEKWLTGKTAPQHQPSNQRDGILMKVSQRRKRMEALIEMSQIDQELGLY